jgi:methionyl-tRNA formyltransferase
LAQKNNLPTIVTGNINDEKVVAKIMTAKPDLGIMADFGQIIGDKVLGIPGHGIINIHPSLLPKYRGPSPIQETILSGDKLAGVALIKTGKKMDAGGIISQVEVELSGSETSTILKKYLSEIAATLLLNSIPYYLAGDLKPEEQKESNATYTKLFKKEDGLVDQNTRSIEVERKIRAFDSWPKVYIVRKGKRVQILSAHFEEDNSFTIDRVKPEGGNEMNYPDYVRGYKDELTFK